MHPALVVQVLQCVSQADDDVGDILVDDGVVAQGELLEVGAVDVVEHHERCSACLAVVAQADDVGVAGQLAHHVEAVFKKLGRAGAAVNRMQSAQGDHLIALIGGQPNLRHAPFVEGFVQYVFAKFLAHSIF